MTDTAAKQGPSHIASLLVLATAVVLPIFFLPGVVDPGNWQKRALLGAVTLGLFGLWAVQSLLTRKVRFVISRTSLFFMGLPLVAIVSSLFTSNPLYHLMNYPVTWLTLALFVLFGSTVAQSLRWSTVLKALMIPATILIAIAGLQFTPLALSEVINSIFGTSYAKSISFTPADSLLAMLTFVIPVAFASLLHTNEDKDEGPIHKVWSGVLLLAAIGLAVAGWSNEATRPFILPWASGWNIAVETLKTPLSLLLGFGPSSFLNAFHQFRGLAYNTQDFWTVRFATSSSELLFLLTTSGLLAVGSLFLAAKSAMPMLRALRPRHFSLVAFAALHGIAFFVIPFTPLLWFTSALALMMIIREAQLLHAEEVWTLQLPNFARSAWITPGITTVTLGALLAVVTFFMSAVLRSNYLLGWTLKQGPETEAQVIYDAQARAMNMVPYHPEYRRVFASTSFQIIQALGQQAQESNTELTAEQQQLSLSLLQQSINEARNAVALDPASTESWELLGNIYSNVLSVEGAPEWAVAARTQAIQTDPINPELRVALGQLYAGLSQPQSALQFYEQAVQLNPRWVQPYYLFGDTALSMENGQAAVVAFTRTLELLDPASQERPVVQDKLRAAQELATKQAAEASAAAARAAQQQGAQGAGTGAAGTQQSALEVPAQPSQPETPEVEPQPAGFDQLL